MFAKGILNPATGEVAKIQGVGYTFDEDKNALIHGDGLTAAGCDQVVFGRNNKKDANKALIVGGGIHTDTHRFTVECWTWSREEEDFPRPGRYAEGFCVKPHIIDAKKIKPKNFDPNRVKEGDPWPFWIVVNVIQDAVVDWDKIPDHRLWGEEGTPFYKHIGQFKVGHIIRLTHYKSDGEFDYIHVDGYDATWKNGEIIFHDGTRYTGRGGGGEAWVNDLDYTDGWWNDSGGGYITNDVAIPTSFFNLFDIDWGGNVAISGNVVAGGDISFTDLLGNEHSVMEIKDSFDDLQQRLNPLLVELDTSGEVITAYHEGDDFHDLFSDNFLNKTFYVRVRLHCLDEDVYVVATAYRYNNGTDKVVDISLGSNVLRITKHSDDSDDITLIGVDEMFLTINESES